MIIQHNMQAMNANRQLGSIVSAQSKSTEKLSSGYRINRAGDDAAGLAISEKMRGQIRGLNQASRNSQDAISLIQTAEGALTETHSILQRMRELSVQAANDTNVTTDRSEIQQEINQLTSEINRIGNTTEFNTMKLLNGDRTSDLQSAVGVTVSAGSTFKAQTKGVKLTGNIGDYIRTSTANGTSTVQDRTGIKLSAVGTAKVSITKSGNSIIVSAEFKRVSGTATASDITAVRTVTLNNTIKANSQGNYDFNMDGLEFHISAEDFDNIADGSTINYSSNKASATSTIRTSATIASTYTYTAKGTAAPTEASVSVKTITGKGTVGPTISNVTFNVVTNTAAATVKGTTATVDVTVELADGTTVNRKIEMKEKIGTAGQTVSLDLGSTGKIEIAFKGISGTGSLTGTLAASDLKKVTSSVTHDVDKAGGESLTFQVGANEHQSMELSIGDMRAAALGITGIGTGFTANAVVSDGTSNVNKENALDVTSASKAANATTVIDNAINKVSSQRSKLGAVQNRLEHTIANLDTSAENLQSAESRIRDVDMAKEMMTFSKNNILQQAAQSMLAQANSSTQGVLSLLQ